jgi:hypothetical protein
MQGRLSQEINQKEMGDEHSVRSDTKKFAIFNGKNFSNWKFRMEILLREHEIEGFLTKSVDEYDEIRILEDDTEAIRTEKNKTKSDMEKKERKCHSMIIQRIHDDYLEYVKDKNNSKEVWSALKATFERKGVANRMFLRRQLLTLKMKDEEDLQEHLLKFDKILRELRSAGAKMEEEDVVCQLLLTLSTSFDSVVTALETMKVEELSIEFVKGRLLDSDTKRKTKTDESNGENNETVSPTAMATASKRDLLCYNCGKKGHYKADCKQNNYRDQKSHSQSHWVYADA